MNLPAIFECEDLDKWQPRQPDLNPDGSAIIYGINRDPYVVATKNNWDVVLPTEYQLQLDIDTNEQFTDFMQNLRTLEKDTGFYFKPFECTPSKSGWPKCHVTLESNTPMSVWQRIALQFYLQSDPIREGLNCKRVLLNDPYPIAFFEVKPQEAK